MKKKPSPRYYLIWMLLSPLVVVLPFALGTWADRNWIFPAQAAAYEAGAVGHPAFSAAAAMLMLGMIAGSIVFLIALVGLIRALRRQKREREGRIPLPEDWSFCPQCGGRLFSTYVCIRCGKKLR